MFFRPGSNKATVPIVAQHPLVSVRAFLPSKAGGASTVQVDPHAFQRGSGILLQVGLRGGSYFNKLQQ